MSSLETPPGDDLESKPKDTSGGPAGIKSSKPPSGPTGTFQQAVKARSNPLRDEVYDILHAKAKKAASALKPLNLPAATLEKAAETVATRKTSAIIAAACEYARKSALAVQFTDGEVLDEILVPLGIAPRKPTANKAAKKKAKRKEKGGRHGNKS